MTITRRAWLWATVGVTTSAALAACSGPRAGDPGPSADPTAPDPTTDPTTTDEPTSLWSPGAAAAALTEIVEREGLTEVRKVDVGPDWMSVNAPMSGGETLTASWSQGQWGETEIEETDSLTSSAGVAVTDLPIDRVDVFARLAGDEADSITMGVDYVGTLRVEAYVGGEPVGMLIDGSDRVPAIDVESVDGVRAAVAEMVAGYGTGAMVIGSFNGFVHMDASVDGVDAGLRIVRRPETSPDAVLADYEAFAADLLFDPTDFDPTLALSRRDGIVEEAGLPGQVWDWEYRRPAPGEDPLVSYGVGESGPSSRVWLDADGAIAEVVEGDCAEGSGWCPA